MRNAEGKRRSKFTKGHYLAVARAVREARAELDPTTNPVVDSGIMLLVAKLALVFQDDNKEFNVVRFLKACN